jgi:hypothetical protein
MGAVFRSPLCGDMWVLALLPLTVHAGSVTAWWAILVSFPFPITMEPRTMVVVIHGFGAQFVEIRWDSESTSRRLHICRMLHPFPHPSALEVYAPPSATGGKQGGETGSAATYLCPCHLSGHGVRPRGSTGARRI